MMAEKRYDKLNLTLVQNMKRKVEELKESEEKYRALVETTGTGFVIIDGTGKVVDANNEYVRLSGHKTVSDIIGRSVVEWTAGYEKERNAKEVAKCFRQGFVKNLEIDYVDKAGKITPIEINATVVKSKEGPLIMTLCRDITERKKAEEVLQESESKYRTLLENLPQKIFLKDRASAYIACNEKYARDLKIKPREIAGRTDYDFYPKRLAEKYRADDKRLMDAGKTEDIEEEYIQGGKKVFVHTIKIPVRDEKGKVMGVLGMFWDISGQKKAEQTLLEQREGYKKEIGRLKKSLENSKKK
jgi:PAS domain S-box-containing protein